MLGGIALSGGRGGVTGALLGAVSLWLIGYVLATFNFGAIQAFMTQMVYGLILVLSLLLTLLVPVLSKYISFLSPWSVFLVLGLVVVGIMLHVGTSSSYGIGEYQAVSGLLGDKYFLFDPVRAVGDDGWMITSIQGLAFAVAFAVIAFVAAARLMDAEADSSKMSLFLYLFVALMIAALAVAILVQPDFQLLGRSS